MTDPVRSRPDEPDPAKENPEALVLRGRPRPVVRFRRGAVIGVAAAVSACLLAVTWFALEPPALQSATGAESTGEPLGNGVPEAIAAAPGSYGEVPRLGPPLPGDLGGAILAHQRSLEEAGAGEGTPAPPGVSPAEAERQRRAAEREAARSSGVLVPLIGAGEPPPGAARTLETPPEDMSPAAAAPPGNPAVMRDPASPWTLSAGTIIPASLITGLNSDMPGTVLAQVTQNVRDSATGRMVLIPQGARLVGRYDSVVAYGQRRVLVVWERIVFPDGSSAGLDDVPAADLAGHAGLEDEVDFHTGRLLTGVALSTLLGVGTELGLGSGESELARALRESAQQNSASAGDRIVSRDLDIVPTITVRPGWPLRAVLRDDLVLQPWKG